MNKEEDAPEVKEDISKDKFLFQFALAPADLTTVESLDGPNIMQQFSQAWDKI